MITGFNTDVEHDGVVYHVQTEDKGLESPIILSLVYAGGTILASKRSPYQDLIASGYSDEVLAERLKRQHRLICAAIHSGRLDDLKRMSSRTGPLTGQLGTPPVVSDAVSKEEEPVTPPETIAEESVPDTQTAPLPPPPVSFEDEIVRGIDAEQEIIRDLNAQRELVEELARQRREAEAEAEEITVEYEAFEAPTLQEPEPQASAEREEFETYVVDEPEIEEETLAGQTSEGLLITLLDEEEFYSGESRMLRVLITERRGRKEKVLSNTPVSIKILGTAFRPLIYSVKTERDGVATVSTEIPEFTTGRAAVLIRVAAKDNTAELRRVIHPTSTRAS